MNDPAVRRFYAAASQIEPTEREVARVLAALAPVRKRRRRAVRRLTLAIALIAAAAIGLAAISPVRSGIEGFLDGGSAPGTPVGLGELPAAIRAGREQPHGTSPAAASQRLLAERDGQRLMAYRDATTREACFVTGPASSGCSSTDDWYKQFGDHALLKLASDEGPTRDGKVAVFGLARSAVARVELWDRGTFVAAAPVTNGGWVLVAKQGTHADLLRGIDQNGHTVDSLDATGWGWTFCFKPSGCSS